MKRSPSKAAAPDPGSLSTPMNFPGLLGVYLAVNAIADAYILVDGPDCTLYKAHFIHGRHDWNSTLLRLDGRHRVAFTNVCSKGVVKEHDAVILEGLRRLGKIEDCGLILATALPMCSITGVDYGRVLRALEPGFPKPAVDIPPDSLSGDWLDGYAHALGALAKGLGLSSERKRPNCAAVVGHLMDRNESDHRANLVQLREMLGALGLDLVSVWLDGESSSRLRAVEEAELVISLPYGRAAARRIAEATGAKLAETVLPFGLPRTIRFMREVGAAAGKAQEAEDWVQRELSRVVPRLKCIIPHLFVNKTAAFIGDPHLLDGFLTSPRSWAWRWRGHRAGPRGHGGGVGRAGRAARRRP